MSKYKVELQGYEINKQKKLTHKEIMALLDEYHQSKDESIKEILVLSNLKLVLSLVQRYHQSQHHLEDLFQVGVIGLIKAIDNFDTSLEVRFSTYAVPLILGEMKRFMRDNSTLRIPRSMRDLAYQALMKSEEFTKLHNRDATSKELANILNVDETLLVEALSSTYNVTSLSQEVQNDGNGLIDLESQIPDRKNHMEEVNIHMDLKEAMNHLDQKELQIIHERYFKGHTQSEIAKELFISQAQVSRIEKQALSQMKKYMDVESI